MNRWSLRPRPSGCAAFLVLALLSGCASSRAPGAGTPRERPAPALVLAPLAGQSLPLLPLTYLVAPAGLAGVPDEQTARLRWADALLEAGLIQRGPEVIWQGPDSLRRMAQRAPGMVTSPDRMGHAMLRATGLRTPPDPLLTNLRPLLVLAGARYAFIPAALTLTVRDDGIEASAVLVMIDVRSGIFLWRSEPRATRATAAEAVAALVTHILPEL